MIWDKEKIRDLRLRLGFSSADLARRLKCDCTAVRNWESGESLPSLQHIDLLNLLSKHAEECADETVHHPLAENLLASDKLGQIDLGSVKRRFSQNN